MPSEKTWSTPEMTWGTALSALCGIVPRGNPKRAPGIKWMHRAGDELPERLQDTSSPPIDAPPMHRYLAELERLPDGSLRISLYRDGEPIHREWARNQRTGRRRIIDLICSAVDADPR